MTDAKVLPFKRSSWAKLKDSKGRPLSGYKVYLPTGMIYFRKTFKKLGIPEFEQSTGETTIGRAKSKAEVMVQQWVNKHLGIDTSTAYSRREAKTLGEIAEYVLENVTPKRRVRTQEKHRLIIPAIVEQIGNWSVTSITEETLDHVIRLEKKRVESEVAKAEAEFNRTGKRTRNRIQRKTFMDYAKYMNLLMRTAYKLKAVPSLIEFENPDTEGAAEGRVYSDAEVAGIWEALQEDTRDQFVLSYECMMRLREVLFLTWDRVDLKTGHITLRAIDVKTGTKTKKGRKFQMSAHAWERLKDRHERRDPRSPHVFPSPIDPMKPMVQNKTAWANAKRRAGIKGKATWHYLRHTAITKALLEVGENPSKVSKYAGVSLQTLEKTYLHGTPQRTVSVASAVSIFKRGGKEAGKNP